MNSRNEHRRRNMLEYEERFCSADDDNVTPKLVLDAKKDLDNTYKLLRNTPPHAHRWYLPVHFFNDPLTWIAGHSVARGNRFFRLYYIDTLQALGNQANHFRGSHIIVSAGEWFSESVYRTKANQRLPPHHLF